MSRIGTKKPPIKNAYYAPQEHVPTMHGNAKTANDKASYMHASNWTKDDFKNSFIDKN